MKKIILNMLALVLIHPAFAADVVWVTLNDDGSEPPSPDDLGWTDLLTAAGHSVDRRTINDLDTNDVEWARLNAADLVIVGPNNDSTLLDNSPLEIERWNRICTPLINLSTWIARGSRWNWVPHDHITQPATLEARLPNHAIFDGVALDALDQVDILERQIHLINGTNTGHGTLLATRSANSNHAWIVHWEAGLEFYPGAGQFTGGPRLLFAAGHVPLPTALGLEILNPEGERIFLNAVDFMLAQPKIKFGFEGYDRPDALTNIPLLVTLNANLPNFAYSNFAHPEGFDLRIWNSNRSELLNYEIDTWNPQSNSYVWVQVPELIGSNTCIHLSWGLDHHTNQPVWTTNGAVWSEGYEGVWHMSETNTTDSSPFQRHASVIGSVTGTAGRIGNGIDFPGTVGHYLEISGYDGILATTNRTVTTWVRHNKDDANLVQWGNGNVVGGRWTLRGQANDGTNGAIRAEIESGFIVHDKDIRDNQWHHAAVTWANDGTPNINDTRLYVDGIAGESVVTDRALDTANGHDVRFGFGSAANRIYDGDLDEVRIARVARSSNWIWAVYRNMASNSTFNRVEAFSNRTLFLASEVVAVSSNSGEVALRVTGLCEDYTLSLFWGLNDGGTDPAAWSNQNAFGTIASTASIHHAYTIEGLEPDRTWHFAWRVTHGGRTNWSGSPPTFTTVAPPKVFNTGFIPGSGGAVLESLLATGAPAHVFIFWGESDGGTDPASWDHVVDLGPQTNNGPLSIQVTGLYHSLSYVYRTFASNSLYVDWSEAATAFLPLDPGRTELTVTFCGYDRPSTLTNFPALIQLGSHLPGFDYETFLSRDGHDLRFWNTDRTVELAYEIDTWDTQGISSIWVEVPELVGATTRIVAAWNNASFADQPIHATNGATWNDHYVGVWHLGDDEGSQIFPDSASTNFASDHQGSDTATDAGRIGEAQFFDGINDELIVAHESNFDFTEEMSISAWFRTGPFSRSWQALVAKGNQANWRLLRQSNTDFLHWNAGLGTSVNTNVNDTQWHHVVANMKLNSGISVYIDGVLAATRSAPVPIVAGDTPMSIGENLEDQGLQWLGHIDELRVSGSIRPADWVQAEWLTVVSNDHFACYDVQSLPPPIQVDVIAATNLTESSATLTGFLTASQSVAEVWLFYGPTDGGSDPAAWNRSRYVGSFSGAVQTVEAVADQLLPTNTYYYTFRATNSLRDVWASTSGHFQTLGVPAFHLAIDFCGYDGTNTLTNFPALIRLSETIPGFHHFDFSSPFGHDLRFYNANRTEIIQYEIGAWSNDGISTVWVRIPELKGTNTRIHAYWGGLDTNPPAYSTNGAVWDPAGYAGVFHLNESATNGRNTAKHFNAATGGDARQFENESTSGVFGVAQHFEGHEDIIETPLLSDQSTGGPGLSFSAWIRVETGIDPIARIFESEDDQQWSLLANQTFSPPRLDVFNGNGLVSSGHDLIVGEWQFVGGIFDPASNRVRVYHNGTENIIIDLGFTNTPEELTISGDGGEEEGFVGTIDEVRFTFGVRDPDWMRTVWLNGASNLAFNCYRLNRPPLPPPGVVTLPASHIRNTSASFNGTITSLTSLAHGWLYYGPVDGGTDPTAWSQALSLDVVTNAGDAAA
ncbi:MAG: LamG-like jellyroll fold domain-containing protein, partial [Verrucomicrobiota bacterium]